MFVQQCTLGIQEINLYFFKDTFHAALYITITLSLIMHSRPKKNTDAKCFKELAVIPRRDTKAVHIRCKIVLYKRLGLDYLFCIHNLASGMHYKPLWFLLCVFFTYLSEMSLYKNISKGSETFPLLIKRQVQLSGFTEH